MGVTPVDLAEARGLASEGVDATALSVLLARSLMALVAADEEEEQVPQVPLVEGAVTHRAPASVDPRSLIPLHLHAYFADADRRGRERGREQEEDKEEEEAEKDEEDGITETILFPLEPVLQRTVLATTPPCRRFWNRLLR